MNKTVNFSKNKLKGIIIAVVIIIAAIIISSSVFVSVPTGHTGVVVSFGQVEDFVLSEGLHFKLPWQEVVKMDNRAQKETIETQAFSSDIQQVDLICSVNFSIDKETAMHLYQRVGEDYYKTVMQPRLYENIKAVFTKYTAENLVASREILSNQIEELLAPEMKEYGIELISVSIEDIDFTDSFTDAVEEKQVAEQSKLKAQIEQEQKTMEQEQQAKRQVIVAQAEAEQAKINADAQAYAVKVEAEAQAEANQKVAASLNEYILKYKEIEKWDGALPYLYSSENGALPILDISGAASGK